MAGEVFKFTGARPAYYDRYLGPFLFEPYGKEMASRVPKEGTTAVLEIASGTGRVTRHLRQQLPSSVKLTATDLSPDMLVIAKTKFTSSDAVEFSVADMQNLPFPENNFDVAVCQFGMMFPPDKQKATNEAYRVLKPGGTFLFSTWEDTTRVDIFKLFYDELLIPFFKGEDTTRFKVPYSMHDPGLLTELMTRSNFRNVHVERIVLPGVADTAESLVKGLFTSHALGQEVKDRNPQAFESIAQNLETEIIARFSNHPVKCELAAYFVSGIK
ncbi:MAG: class I SAM-dependent methyltransferase [Cyclobacteriaceae bacterium]|nr:class I SAM-dependent methyltransferase [Cyclobacteriaceae bacterium]